MVRLANVLKISLQDVLKTSWRRLEEVLKTFWRRLEDVFKTSWRRLGKTSWRRLGKTSSKRLEASKRLEDVLKTYAQDEYIGLDQDVLKTSSEDVRLSRTYSSWPRHFEDVFWRRRRKTSSRRLHQDECLLGCAKHFLVTEASF